MEKFSVDYYLKFKSDRVDSTIQYESHRLKLDYNFLKEKVIADARKKADDYDDAHGTSGFIKWFSNVAYMMAAYYFNNSKIYREQFSAFQAPKIEVTQTRHIEQPIKTPEAYVPLEVGGETMDEADFTKVERDSEMRIDLTQPGKVCSWCNVDKELNFFHKNKTQPDGHAKVCKKCHNGAYGGVAAPGKKDSTRKTKFISHAEAVEKKSEFTFTTDEIVEMIQFQEGKLIEAEKVYAFAAAEVDRIKTFITKLERRKR